MIAPAMGAVLLFGSDQNWRQALQVDVEPEGWQTIEAHSLADLPARLQAAGRPLSAAIIAAFGNQRGDGPEDAMRAADAVRKRAPNLPLLFDISVPDYGLTNYVFQHPPAKIVCCDRESAVRLLKLVRRTRRLRPGVPPRFAAFEIRCDLAAITFEARLDSDADPFGPFPVPSLRAERLQDINDHFKTFRLYQRTAQRGRFLTDDWDAKLKDAGTELCDLIGLTDGAQAAVLAAYVKQLGHISHVHFRFNLARNGMEHVPFELVWDRNKKLHLRELAPIARRVVLDEREVVGCALTESASLRGDVVFIRSPAEGSVLIEGSNLYFAKLQCINKEYADLDELRRKAGLPAPRNLLLSRHGNAAKIVRDFLDANHAEIIHFAGHSICTGCGQVYLVLPGEISPVALRVQDFAEAAYRSGARLVVLSSCESTSPDAVFRLAQAGIPAVIGFRWEVDDAEAAEFTQDLHRKLAAGEPVGRAFHWAVQSLRANHPNSPTFASPMLIVQHDAWAHPIALAPENPPHVSAGTFMGQPQAHPREGRGRPRPAQNLHDGAQGAAAP